MTAAELADFIQHTMRMSHGSQPVMLMTLLQNGGQATARMIADAILAHDKSQLEYYDQISRQMVGLVLQRDQIVVMEGEMYRLLGFNALTPPEAVCGMSLRVGRTIT